MIDVERLLLEEAAAWRDLEATFAAVPADRFEEPTLTPEGWSPKDAMFHVAGWMRDCAVQLEAMRSGAFDASEETRDSIERQNQAWFEESRDLPAQAVRWGFVDARRRMLDAFAAVTTVSPVAVEWFEESGALHYPKHVEDLRAFLGGGA
jgi:Mycothiol maleylpyruvate isomerase N-terminal domain